ncbi:MAG: DUF885 domain-containing protein [Mesorhizobium sp.]
MQGERSHPGERPVDENIAVLLDTTIALMKREKLGGLNAVHVPEISEEEAARKASAGRAILARIDAMDLDALAPDIRRTIAIARHQATCWSTEERHYWVASEGTGNYRSLFVATAATIGEIVPHVLERLDELARSDATDAADAYLQGCENLARSLNQMAVRTQGQAARGIFMPQLAYAPGIELVRSLSKRALASPSHAVFRPRSGAMARRLALALDAVQEGFQRLEAVMDSDYRMRCPEAIGIAQYPDGETIYQDLIYHNTTTSLTPRDIHAIGVDSVQSIVASMNAVAREAGFCDARDYRKAVEVDSAWRSSDPGWIAAMFERYMARMAPLLGDLFHPSEIPRANPAAVPLPQFLESTLAYGCYEAPRDGRETGYFLFNAATFGKRPLFDVAAFTFHELMPGHHLHLAGQREDTSLHPVQRLASYASFNEGWAEYGRRLAEENAMYHVPAEAFGGLCSDMRQATRLVVDTGVNALGWSQAQAGAFLRENLQVSDAEIDGMLFWYGCEIPAQSLAYSLGRETMLDLRRRAHHELDGIFDLKDFHRVVLRGGSRPFASVEADVDAYILAARHERRARNATT